MTDLKLLVEKEGLLKRTSLYGSLAIIELFTYIVVCILLAVFTSSIIAIGIAILITLSRAIFVVHDLLHGQYFKDRVYSRKLANAISYIIVGAAPSWWEASHNGVHHKYANIPTKDSNAVTSKLSFVLSFLVLYPFMVFRGYQFAILKGRYKELLYLQINVALWITLCTFFGIQLLVFVAIGFSLWTSIVFSVNHIGCEVFTEAEANALNWEELQLRTTRSISGGAFTTWFYGGLNMHIEHHLFPNASRFNMNHIQAVVRSYCKANDICYNYDSKYEAYLSVIRYVNNLHREQGSSDTKY